MKRYKLVPDFDSPNKMYIYDLRDGNRVVAIYYDNQVAIKTVEYLNTVEDEVKVSDYFMSGVE